jgi:uncharacterized cupredoxin-like copper-binding protein
MKRLLVGAAVVAALGATPIVLQLTRSGAAADSSVTTVELGVHYSRFSTNEIVVKAGTTVRFVVTNDDPILHELIVGPPDVQQRHENGTEAAHPPRPGEITIQPKAGATTEYRFDQPGSIEFACHLPGHHAYGMTGQVRVDP